MSHKGRAYPATRSASQERLRQSKDAESATQSTSDKKSHYYTPVRGRRNDSTLPPLPPNMKKDLQPPPSPPVLSTPTYFDDMPHLPPTHIKHEDKPEAEPPPLPPSSPPLSSLETIETILEGSCDLLPNVSHMNIT